MAEGFLKGSQSAEGINKRGKPGKLSSELLSTFESGGPLTRPHSLPVDRFPGPVPGRLGAHSFTSSSEEVIDSQENVKEKKCGVTIKVPMEVHEHLSPSSADDDILSDSEELEGKKKKKRKSRWKWSPFKKMRNLFRRKKSPPRAKSCEELPVEHHKPTNETGHILVDDSLRNRAKSEPSLAESGPKTLLIAAVHERRNTGESLVQRTQSDSSGQHVAGKSLGFNKTKRNQQETGEEPSAGQQSSDERESRANSMTGLDWNLINSADSGTEGAVSFETLPSASSLEGLHVAHDRIKVAPKHRRPPSRAQPKSSSMNLKSNPSKPHRRSKTDPQDLLRKGDQRENSQAAESNRSSDVVNKTIYEAPESGEQQTKESVVADMKAKASATLSKLPESQEPSKTENTTDADAANKKEEKESTPMKTSTNLHEESKIQKLVKTKVIENGDTRIKTECDDSGENKEQRAEKILNDQEKKKEMGITAKEQTEGKTAISKVSSEGNKENEMEEDERILSPGSNDEDTRNGEAILREVNGYNDENKPSLDKSKKSLSNKRSVMKDSTTDQVKPVVRKGVSLNSIGHYSIEPMKNSPDAIPKTPADKGKINGVALAENKNDQSDRSVSAEIPSEVIARKQEANTTQSAVNELKTNTPSHEKNQAVKLREKPRVKKEEPASASGQPAWIELANRRSKRYSEFLEDADQKATQKSESRDKVRPEVLSSSVENKNKPTVTEKPNVASKPSGNLSKSHSLGPRTENKTMSRRSLTEKSHSLEKTGSSFVSGNRHYVVSRSQEPNSKPVGNSSASKSKATTGTTTEKPNVAVKPTTLVDKTVDSGQVYFKALTNRATEKKAMFRKSFSEEAPNQDKVLSSSFRGRSALLEKCVVCGTTVYQMEKCNFDNSVFHRKCIKCTVCKRLLTVGNFVVSESKVYCKPHGQAVIVSM